MQLDIMRRTITSSRWMAVLSLVVLGVLVGCSGKPKVSHSGFLRGDYSQLKKDPAAEGALAWLAPKSKLRQGVIAPFPNSYAASFLFCGTLAVSS